MKNSKSYPKPYTEEKQRIDVLMTLFLFFILITNYVNTFQWDVIKLQNQKMREIVEVINNDRNRTQSHLESILKFEIRVANDFYNANIEMPNFNSTQNKTKNKVK